MEKMKRNRKPEKNDFIRIKVKKKQTGRNYNKTSGSTSFTTALIAVELNLSYIR